MLQNVAIYALCQAQNFGCQALSTILHPCLTHPRFEVVEGMADADVLWLTSHFKDFEALSKEMPDRRINQFPCENVITIKDFLAVACRRQGGKGQGGPAWLPTTFNLETELLEF